MKAEEALELAAELIAVPSLSGEEAACVEFLDQKFKSFGWRSERIPAGAGGPCLLVRFGDPRIVFTTHIDVVPAPAHLFTPRIAPGKNALYGRGACDAKGILAAMTAACAELLARGKEDFALLVVTEEELTGAGARYAARYLQGRGVQFVVNGEPTENRLITAHKGGLGFRAVFKGRSCHSGYPEQGEDANRKLLNAAERLGRADFGSDTILGAATINLGIIRGGTAGNIVSDHAELVANIRTVRDNTEAARKVRECVGEEADLQFDYDIPAARMLALPGFETGTASFCTDIPNFRSLGCESVLYGPGSILRAHTTEEFITETELDEAIDGYLKIFDELTRRQDPSRRGQ